MWLLAVGCGKSRASILFVTLYVPEPIFFTLYNLVLPEREEMAWAQFTLELL